MSRRANTRQKELPRRENRWWLTISIVLAIGLVAVVILLPRSSSPSVETRTPQLTDATALLSSRRVDEAEQVLRALLHQNPESRPARDELRWVFFNQFRRREVEAILEDGLSRNPDDLSLAVDLLMSEFRPQNPRELVRYWERVRTVPIVQPNSLSALGYCYWKLGQTEEARQAIETALNAQPDDFRLRILAAEFLLDTGSLASADPLLDSLAHQVTDAKRLDETKPSWESSETIYLDRYWWLESLRSESQDDLKLALRHLEKALTLRPKEIAYLQRRGTLLRQLGLEAEAIESFRAANQQEAHVGRLTEIVLGDELQQLTTKACQELAEICRQRNKPIQAHAWQRAAERAPG